MSTTTTPTPIQTAYAGCLFRSRLEARWAVCFDSLGIRWEYEAQGYELPHRLTMDEGVIRYLPDFWLPGLNAHVEVKGSLTDVEMVRLLECAAAISAPTGGCGDGPDMIVCGHIPRPGTDLHPVALHMHKGGLLASGLPSVSRCMGSPIATDVGGADVTVYPAATIIEWLLGGYWSPVAPGYPARFGRDDLERAYTAARSARFEHGETPR